MGIIRFKEADCKDCYKCLRECDVKAIKIIDSQAHIIDESCILCGKCTTICPQHAHEVKSDLNLVKGFLKSGANVIASISPAYVSAFPNISFSEVSAALKKLGFTKVEESAIGATEVSQEYSKLMRENNMDNIISSFCPSIVLLIEEYYPELIKYLAPVVSPTVAHGKMIKELYGRRNKVVSIGPCISEIYGSKKSKDVNGVLTFDELKNWMRDEDIDFNEKDKEALEMHETLSRIYPMPGGVLRTLNVKLSKNYKMIHIDGLKESIEILDSLRDNDIKGYFIEMSTCSGSCLKGPGLGWKKEPYLICMEAMTRSVNKKSVTIKPLTENLKVDLRENYKAKNLKKFNVKKDEIDNILIKMGRVNYKSMLNCGTCGYDSCREKAVAVYKGNADVKICLAYMRENLESFPKVIMDNIHFGILSIDKNLKIIEYNKFAQKLLNMNYSNMLLLDDIIECEDLKMINTNMQPIHDIHALGKNTDKSLRVSLIPIPNDNILVVLKDVTEEERVLKEIENERIKAIEKAQKAVDKQMRVAQEVALILGETTGETKAILNKLKKL